MKRSSFYTHLAMLAVGWVFLGFFHQGYAQGHKESVSIENGKLRIGFDKESGCLVTFEDLATKTELLDREENEFYSPWELELFHPSQVKKVDNRASTHFSFRKVSDQQIVLEWSQFSTPNPAIKVIVMVSLDKEKPMSYWKISLEGIKGEKISQLSFPRIAYLKEQEDEHLAVAEWMGSLLQNPRTRMAGKPVTTLNLAYPDHMSMQFLALYNPNKLGLYLSCNDTLGYAKNFVINIDSARHLSYHLENYPVFSDELSDYTTSYEAVIGSFVGDWLSAAGLYAAWGREQSWAKNSRLKSGEIPQWLKDTGYWVWNRGRADNVLSPAVNLRKKLDMPVSVLWHWWHNGSYDDSFPEYFPPRDGKPAFTQGLSYAKENQVNAIVYMNQLKWGPSTDSWKTEHASRYAAKDMNGQEISHVYNIFTGKALTYMCMATDFWKRKYASLADSAVNHYGTSGVYMDQACLSRICYAENHDHDPGGGNYWITHFGLRHQLIRQLVPASKNAVFAGEGGGELWLPYLDAFLTLAVSKERYAGVSGAQPIPLFQAVYHQYGITYGNYSSLLTPPYDEKWPEEFAPSNAETLLSAEFNQQFLMEQARSFVWGMQPMIANYQPFLDEERADEMDYLTKLAKVRQKGLKYLLYGEFLRPPKMSSPEERMKISKLSIYAGQKEKVTTFEQLYPVIYSAAWRADDNDIAVAIASISKETFPVNFVLKAADYGLPSTGKVYLIDQHGRKLMTDYTDGQALINWELEPKGIVIFEFTP